MSIQRPHPSLLDFVERYQRLYTQDPHSRFFAPLVEGYRQMGFLKQAESIAKEGLQHHPHFAAGHVCYAKVLLELQQSELAIQHLQKAIDLSPENLLASRLLGDIWMKAGKAKEALKCYKTVVFFAPNDSEAIKRVKQLESMTADEYPPETFEMINLKITPQRLDPTSQETQTLNLSTESEKSLSEETRVHTLETALSLADAFFIRNNFQRSLEIIDSALHDLGPEKVLLDRKRILTQRGAYIQSAPLPKVSSPKPLQSPPPLTGPDQGIQHALAVDKKIRVLESLLQKIEQKRSGPSLKSI